MQIFAGCCYRDPAETVAVFSPGDIQSGIDRIQELRDQGFYLLGYMRYSLEKSHEKGCPLIFFEAFRSCEDLRDTANRDAAAPGAADTADLPVGIAVIPLISREEYFNKIAFIREQILNGIAYEVNYTYPSLVKASISGLSLYNYLLRRQQTPYNAFLENRYETIMSFSPELFFRIKGRHIVTKPMKGTIRRGHTPEEDRKNRDFLARDPKNRAENLMIADLLRNDLGMIARDGTVRADRLFAIEEHPTVFQMTSEISAELRSEVSLYDIIRALYPCGSITGAPKLSAMRVIREAELFDREVYCGAIAWLHGDEAVFSVPIRILQKQHDEQYFRYYAGGAVTFDSTAADEWEETLAKTKFLESGFSLIETGTGNQDRELHLSRLRNSAREFGFAWPRELDSFAFPEDRVARIELFRDGRYAITERSLPEPAVRPRVRINGKVNSQNPFLYHKTSVRSPAPRDFFEEIRVNERNEITEGTFTNVAAQIGDTLFTPPVSSGLLNGVMRQRLIRDGVLREKTLSPEDLRKSARIFCMNSVRGMFEVELCS